MERVTRGSIDSVLHGGPVAMRWRNTGFPASFESLIHGGSIVLSGPDSCLTGADNSFFDSLGLSDVSCFELVRIDGEKMMKRYKR